jgi:hypothetical protein
MRKELIVWDVALLVRAGVLVVRPYRLNPAIKAYGKSSKEFGPASLLKKVIGTDRWPSMD